MNIKQIPFNNYLREASEKKQIVLHHTAGGGKGEIVYHGWQADRSPVASSTPSGLNSSEVIQSVCFLI